MKSHYMLLHELIYFVASQSSSKLVMPVNTKSLNNGVIMKNTMFMCTHKHSYVIELYTVRIRMVVLIYALFFGLKPEKFS